MKGIIWHLRGEYAHFRPFYQSSIIDTYQFPPKTAIIGMIGATLGLRDDELVPYYELIKVGIKIDYYESVFNDLVKIWKIEKGDTKTHKWCYLPEDEVYEYGELKKKIDIDFVKGIFVVIKRFLYKPRFTIYLATPSNEDLIEKIQKGLEDPVYPITLGDSDSLFYPKNPSYFELVPITPTKSRYFKCLIDALLVGGMHYPKDRWEEGEFRIHPRIVKMPIGFDKGRTLRKPINVLLHAKGEIELKEEVKAYEFKGEPIYLF